MYVPTYEGVFVCKYKTDVAMRKKMLSRTDISHFGLADLEK